MSGGELTELPKGWTWITLGQVIESIEAGKSFKCEERPPQGDEVGVIKVSAVTWGEFDESESKTCTDPDRIEPRFLIQPGDFLFSRANTLSLVGSCVIVRTVSKRLMLSDKILRLRLSGINAKWVLYALRTQHGRQEIERLATGNQESMRNIGQDRIRQIRIPMAPPDEQTRIIEELEKQTTRLDAGTALLESARNNLKRYRASVLKAACEGRLVPTEASLAKAERRDYETADTLLRRILSKQKKRSAHPSSNITHASTEDSGGNTAILRPPASAPFNFASLPPLPEGWCWASVDMVGDVLLGRQRAPQYLTGRFSRPYLRVANVKDDALDFSDIETMDFDEEHFKKYSLLPNDVLISEGQSPELVGQSAIYRGGIDGLCFQKTLHRFRTVPEGPGPEFAQIVFRSHVKTGVFRKLASITTNIAHLTLEKLKSAPFPLPPRAEQERITTEVARLLSIANALDSSLTAQINRAGHLKQAVFKLAFEGKLTHQNPAAEPAQGALKKLAPDTMRRHA